MGAWPERKEGAAIPLSCAVFGALLLADESEGMATGDVVSAGCGSCAGAPPVRVAFGGGDFREGQVPGSRIDA